MLVIVDYDNLPPALRAKGPRSLAEKILELLSDLLEAEDSTVTFKLYGGWYSQTSLTQSAQALVSAMYDDFPFVWNLLTTSSSKLYVNGSLAHSLEVDPKQPLPNTLRQRSRRRKGRWAQPSERGCSYSECPLALAIEHFHSDRCARHTCAIKPSELIAPEPEQKMVDTMMVADIIYVASRGDESVAVVTSDDDVWPGILSAMMSGARVLHVQPRPSTRAWQYANGRSGRYVAIPF